MTMSPKDTALERILDQAIRFEEDAYQFYTKAMTMVKRPNIKDTLQDLARQEVKHKQRLQALLEGNTEAIVAIPRQGKIEDLKLAEYLVSRPLDENASFQDVLIVAMQREKSSHDFYSTMAGIAEGAEAKSLFQFLAQEELLHKNKVESLYDEVLYKDF
jgi:rubrerythrin